MLQTTPFRRILIANRGEIALRVMRSARALGYETVAVFSDADRDARHAREADAAVRIGEAAPASSYLAIDRIIAAARLSGADAVHPGYGFLAENAAFAQACREASLVFIGPSPQAIAAMGDKARAKRILREAGVPCVPGYEGDDQSDATLATAAAGIGFPVMIKAAAGGGGRGMRLVAAEPDFAEALHAARAEAKSAFGDDRVLVEKAVTRPRHVEIQVFGDRYGAAIHLGERDCSVQRRHQKLIEEAPSPAVTPSLRARMGAAAVAAVKAMAYEGAGTLEFLLEASGAFYFMEMNTRLQVEHPVTEAITGLDLVELQLRIAAGEPLALKQDDVRFSGHAIEARLCAEDPADNFLPQSGRLALWRPPSHARVEDALESGADISPHYDSMIAKIICHGADREEARRKLIRALTGTVALGVPTNAAFLTRALADPAFAEGGATTAFVAEGGARLVEDDPEEVARITAIAAALLATPPQDGAASSLGHRLPVARKLTVGRKPHETEVAFLGQSRFRAVVDGRAFEIAIAPGGSQDARVDVEGLVEPLVFVRDGASLFLHHRGLSLGFEDGAYAVAESRRGTASDGKIRAALSGRVVSVEVAIGERVQPGQRLLTLEAMKMQHVHTAPFAGTVRALPVVPDEQVAAHRIVAEIEKDDARTGAPP